MTIKQKACEGKQRYRGHQEAKNGVRYLVSQYGLHRSQLSCYQCPFCRWWHVGNRRPEIEKIDRDLDITSHGDLILQDGQGELLVRSERHLAGA